VRVIAVPPAVDPDVGVTAVTVGAPGVGGGGGVELEPPQAASKASDVVTTARSSGRTTRCDCMVVPLPQGNGPLWLCQ
jgi:hypothetical protein